MASFKHRRFGAAVLLTAALGFWFALVAAPAVAQQPTNHIRNRGNPTLFLNSANGAPTAEQIQPGTPSAQWSLEPVPGEILMRIRNAESGAYLHTQDGVLQLGDAAPGQVSAEWQVEPVPGTFFVRFRNAETGLYLALQEVTGPLGVVALDLTGTAAEPGSPTFAAPQAGATNDTAPAIAEWEFIVSTGIPLVAAPSVPVQNVVPQVQERRAGRQHVRRRQNLLSRSVPLPDPGHRGKWLLPPAAIRVQWRSHCSAAVRLPRRACADCDRAARADLPEH